MVEKIDSTEVESQKQNFVLRDYEWLVRPCENYKEEYKECKKFRSRFHQHFIFGEAVNCEQWKEDHKNCLLFKQGNEDSVLEKIVDSEKVRIHSRLQPHYVNDVWESRTEPPKDWNAPLKEDFLERAEQSYMAAMIKEQEQVTKKAEEERRKKEEASNLSKEDASNLKDSTSCCIS